MAYRYKPTQVGHDNIRMDYLASKKKGAEMDKVGKVMREYKKGKLHSGSKKGLKVGSRAQALAIALSEQRKQKK